MKEFGGKGRKRKKPWNNIQDLLDFHELVGERVRVRVF